MKLIWLHFQEDLASNLNNTRSLASSFALNATSAALGVHAAAQADANTAITNINDVNFMLVSPFKFFNNRLN